jgi:hypothetical protein
MNIDESVNLYNFVNVKYFLKIMEKSFPGYFITEKEFEDRETKDKETK